MRVKGCKHYESKVIKMAEGGSVPGSNRKTESKIVRPKKTEELKTTRTSDGGQQYVRNNDYKVADDAERKYYKRAYKDEILNPKASKALAKAVYYAMNPDQDSSFPEKMGKIAEEGAEAQNELTRKRTKKDKGGR